MCKLIFYKEEKKENPKALVISPSFLNVFTVQLQNPSCFQTAPRHHASDDLPTNGGRS